MMQRLFIHRSPKDRGFTLLEKTFLTGFTLVEVLLTVSLLALVLVAMTPFIRTVNIAWNLGDRKTELQQNGRVGLEMMSRLLRQAKRMTGIPPTGSGDYVKFRNWADNQTIIFYFNQPASAFYIGNTGLIKEDDLVMRTIDAGGTNNGLLASSLSNFTINFKNSTGGVAGKPSDVSAMDISMSLTDPQGLISDIIEIFSTLSLRSQVKIDKIGWLTSGNNIVELSRDDWISGFSSPNAVSVNNTLLVNGRETVWVADTGGNRIRRIYWNGSAWAYDTVTGFSSPRSVSVNPYELVNGRETCWVADTSGNRIRRIVWTGSAWSYSSGGGATITGFSGPRSVSVNPSDTVGGRHTCWVADTGGNRVRKIYWNTSTSAYTYLNYSTATGSAPYCVSVSPAEGACWVALSGTNATNGRRVKKLVSIGTAAISLSVTLTGFSTPYSVSVNLNPPRDCWVADTGNNSIKKFPSGGGSPLFTKPGFLSPWAVSVDSTSGSCWIADTNNNQVVKLDTEGNEEFRISGFSTPLSIAVER